MLSKYRDCRGTLKQIGNVVGNNDVSGAINKIDGSGKLSNAAFIGKVHAAGNRGGYFNRYRR